MTVRQIHISDYNYTLPAERIARYPLPQRDHSKLLVYRKGDISEHVFKDIADFLPADSLLVYNNTKVIQARLHFRKETGALIEIFCLEPHAPNDYQLIFDQREQCEWQCLIGNKKKWKSGALHLPIHTTNGKEIVLSAEVTGQTPTSNIVRFSWNDSTMSFAEILEAVGELPIPPYLNRETEESDKQTYQTVYSKIDGSVAAPTAGLHFTDDVFKTIAAKGIECDEVTLHVGAGTFKPVKSELIEDHEMHSEYIYVTRHSIERLIAHGAQCTAVGTTSVRTLESLYYIGCKIIQNPDISEEQLHVKQWLPYSIAAEPADAATALSAILQWMDKHHTNTIHTTTQIIIAPGYTYHIVKRIITNFHMPQSTLLLLVSALIGDDWKRVYDYALSHDFRFLSYGDSSLLEP